MNYSQTEWTDIHCKLSLSTFSTPNGVSEYHVILEITNAFLSAEEQFANLEEGVTRWMSQAEQKKTSLVWKRYFVSDAVNQQPFIRKTVNEALSVVQQAPLTNTKAALWLYAIDNATVYTLVNGDTLAERPNYSHHFSTQLHSEKEDSYSQTEEIFNRYIDQLAQLKATINDHCIRTWLYIQDVDIQYMGMVKARRERFEKEGLTSETHFIASTGIEGRYVKPHVIALMDAYAIPNIRQEQITYLHGASHLNPTHEYGVTFERGTAVQYGDRRHVFISGTASIDNKGEIVHPLDILKQTIRTLENIQVLLAEAGCETQDIVHLFVYLRDMADYPAVSKRLEVSCPRIPTVYLLAPVCRPGWLIEIECMAVKAIGDSRFGTF